MTDLSARAEQAKPDEARGLLEELARRVWGWDECPNGLDPDFWVQRWVTFNRRRNCEAYLDAAMMLVPEGWTWRIMPADSRTAWLVEVWQSDDEDDEFGARGVTPALAMIAAIARSQGQ